MNYRALGVAVAFVVVAFIVSIGFTYGAVDQFDAVRNAVDALTITLLVFGAFVIYALYRK